MRHLGLQKILSPSSAPVIVVVVLSTATRLPTYAWVQESQSDVMEVIYNGAVVPCKGILDDVSVRATRPSSGGGLRRNVTTLKFNVENTKGYPIFEDPILKSLYYGGSNFDDFYFGIFGIDRVNLNEDLLGGASYGFYKVDNEIDWTESDGTQTINLLDITLTQDNIVGATEEVIDDTFFIYNSWYDANFFPKAYGQVPRIKVLNAFPSFGIKNFSASISGRVRSNYTDTSPTILLEENTDQASLLLQAANIGGIVRIRMNDSEVIAGTLDYDDVDKTITLVVTERNTYYNRVAAYNDSLDGRTPDQWGLHPSYVSVRFSPFQTVIPNAKDLILDQNGYMQADIWFFDAADSTDKGVIETDCVCQIQGLLDQRKDVVIHSYWIDSRYPSQQNQGSISGYYNNTSNTTYLPSDQVPQWGVAGFQFLKFRDEVQFIKLFFNDPSVSIPGSGSIGDQWQMVNIEPDEVDTSCYIRNGYSRFDVDHVYVEGEGKLIKVPSGNVTITQSGTFYGLTNLCKIALTATPLDMNIGAKSNIVYVDALFKNGTDLESRTENVLKEIIKEDPTLESMLGNNFLTLQENNYLPYIGWVAKTETKLTEIIDRICYQCGITLQWRRDKFQIQIVGWNQDAERIVTVEEHEDDPDTTDDDDIIYPPPGDYVEVLAPYTDENEMLENSAGVKIGKLRTSKYADDGEQEFIPLYFKATYGGWEDPFYPNVRSSNNRNIKPYERVVEYHFDLINDINSYLFAVGKSLSIGHPSGYGLAQRSLSTDMCMDGARWDAMDPIVFHQFPLISTTDETNGWYNNDGNKALLYPAREDGKHYIMGAVCVVEDISYDFNVDKPVVKIQARNSQTFVYASGVPVYGPPGPPELPTIPTDPNVPPNAGGGNGGHTVVGNDWLMPQVIDPEPVSSISIDRTEPYDRTFTITVDAGFVFNKGWSYNLYIDIPGGSVDNVLELNVHGAEVQGDTTGVFPDKTDDDYVPPIYTVVLYVNYLWFNDVSEGTTNKPLKMILHRRWSEGGEVQEDFIPLNAVSVNRLDVTGVEGT
jgi:hypothetical protein